MNIINGEIIICESCRYFKDGICTNVKALCFAEEVDKEQSCGKWEREVEQ